jgi:hypothetical protein
MNFGVILIALSIVAISAGCITPHENQSTIVVKDIRVINNVHGDWGDFCPCSILGDDGIVYTATRESCVKLPIGMNATITSDIDAAQWTGYRCAIYDVEVHK